MISRVVRPTSQGRWCTCSEVYRVLSAIFDRKPFTVSLQKQLAKALMYPVHMAKIASRSWEIARDPIVDAFTSDRAYSMERARNKLGYFSTCTLGKGLKEIV
jgi:hypothetical protein